MDNNDARQQLHDRATRGERLSAVEQAQLIQWYARQDQEEGDALALAGEPQSLVALRRQVETAVAELRAATERLQSLTAENEVVRREIVVLEQQFAQQAAT